MSTANATTLREIVQPSTLTRPDFVNDLVYENYRFNRQNSPETSVERWAKVYGLRETAEMEMRYQYDLLRLFIPRQVNEQLRCDATVDLDAGGAGNGFACNQPTVRCPGCGEPANVCDEHLWEQPCGLRVCCECDGKPEFQRRGPDAAEVYEGLCGKVGA